MAAAVHFQTHDAHRCEVRLSRFDGPLAVELFAHARPLEAADVTTQANAVYLALRDALAHGGADTGDIVAESSFVRDAALDMPSVRSARGRVFAPGRYRAAVTQVAQPPLLAPARVEVSMQAVVARGTARVDTVRAGPDIHALRVRLGPETRLYAAGLGTRAGDAEAQTTAAFGQAQDLLRAAGLGFGNVARTWLHLPDIERDYAALNRARRAFFAEHNVAPAPASTGIGAVLASPACRLGLGFYAVADTQGVAHTVMTSPTLNEAPQYGADFVRGLALAESNRTALMVSGTASINEHGASVHRGDLVAQAERMLLNIRTLLERQGAGLDDIACAISYVKHTRHADQLRRVFADAGFDRCPNALVQAQVCRPELLCETEVLALLPPTA